MSILVAIKNETDNITKLRDGYRKEAKRRIQKRSKKKEKKKRAIKKIGVNVDLINSLVKQNYIFCLMSL